MANRVNNKMTNPQQRHLQALRQAEVRTYRRLQDIRASERRFYQKITGIYAIGGSGNKLTVWRRLLFIWLP